MMKYILYLHIWLAIIAMLLTMESMIFFSSEVLYFNIIFSGIATLFTYNAHTLFALFSKRNSTEVTSWGRKKYNIVFATVIVSLMVNAYICIQYFTLYQLSVLLASAALWFLYELYIITINQKKHAAVRNYTFFKSIVIAIVWTIITSILPLIENDLSVLNNSNIVLFVGVRFCLLAFITQLFEYRDLYIEKGILKTSHLSGKTIGYSNITVLCYLFFAAIVLQLFILELHVSFKIATLLQIVFLLFCLRIKNIVTLTPSMLVWDGILILSPLMSIPALYL